MNRSAFLAMCDQDVSSSRAMINQLVTDYGENLNRMDEGDDEVDVVCSLIEFLSKAPLPCAEFGRDAHLATYLAVAVKVLHEERQGRA